MQDHEIIEAKIREYENALDSAADIYRDIQELVTTQSNNYNLDVMTRLTTTTINFKNTIEQTDAAWVLRASRTHILAVLFLSNLVASKVP